jgi:hypothetical protein
MKEYKKSVKVTLEKSKGMIVLNLKDLFITLHCKIIRRNKWSGKII